MSGTKETVITAESLFSWY